jgi:KipI family sensor histidine kinase inhibitor
MRIRLVGEDALLVECADLTEMRSLHAAAVAHAGRLDVVDIVPAARTLLLDGLADRDAVAAELPGWELSEAAPPDGSVVEVPVRYDGPDLDEVARRWGVRRAAVGERHAGHDFVVAFCGFAPGFAYISGLPDHLSVPRRDTPRPRVPAGSVGLAGGLTGIYPRASPGGWQLIGHTDIALWDEDRQPPALLAPGTRVRFVPDG